MLDTDFNNDKSLIFRHHLLNTIHVFDIHLFLAKY